MSGGWFGREFREASGAPLSITTKLAGGEGVRGQLAVFNSQWVRAATVYCRPAGGYVSPIAAEPLRAFPVPGDRVTLMNLNEAKGGRLFGVAANDASA